MSLKTYTVFFGIKCSKTEKNSNVCRVKTIYAFDYLVSSYLIWQTEFFGFLGNRPNTGRKKKRYKSFQFAPVNPNHKKPGRRDLVYFDSSPSYCEKDTSIDFPGTYGRECNATSIGIDGCDLLCCGRGYVSKSYMVRERCSCIFRWCCDVKCEVCTRTKVLHTCK